MYYKVYGNNPTNDYQMFNFSIFGGNSLFEIASKQLAQETKLNEIKNKYFEKGIKQGFLSKDYSIWEKGSNAPSFQTNKFNDLFDKEIVKYEIKKQKSNIIQQNENITERKKKEELEGLSKKNTFNPEQRGFIMKRNEDFITISDDFIIYNKSAYRTLIEKDNPFSKIKDLRTDKIPSEIYAKDIIPHNKLLTTYDNFITFGDLLYTYKNDPEIIKDLMQIKTSSNLTKQLENRRKSSPIIKENLKEKSIPIIKEKMKIQQNKSKLLNKKLMNKNKSIDFIPGNIPDFKPKTKITTTPVSELVSPTITPPTELTDPSTEPTTPQTQIKTTTPTAPKKQKIQRKVSQKEINNVKEQINFNDKGKEKVTTIKKENFDDIPTVTLKNQTKNEPIFKISEKINEVINFINNKPEFNTNEDKQDFITNFKTKIGIINSEELKNYIKIKKIKKEISNKLSGLLTELSNLPLEDLTLVLYYNYKKQIREITEKLKTNI